MYGSFCEICKGIGEIQCLACEGKAAYVSEDVSTYKFLSTEQESGERNRDFTTARQVQTILYLLEESGLPDIEKTEIARFIHFLTGKNYHNIYEKVRSPLKSREQTDNADLVYIKDWFRRLGLTKFVEKIESAIKMKGV